MLTNPNEQTESATSLEEALGQLTGKVVKQVIVLRGVQIDPSVGRQDNRELALSVVFEDGTYLSVSGSVDCGHPMHINAPGWHCC